MVAFISVFNGVADELFHLTTRRQYVTLYDIKLQLPNLNESEPTILTILLFFFFLLPSHYSVNQIINSPPSGEGGCVRVGGKCTKKK